MCAVELLRRELDQAPGEELQAALAAARRARPAQRSGTSRLRTLLGRRRRRPTRRRSPSCRSPISPATRIRIISAYGIAEDITTDLSKISGLFVIARNSAFVYRDPAVRVQDVCRDLGVRYIVQGSIRKVGNRVRITIQLSDGNTGGQSGQSATTVSRPNLSVQDDVTRQSLRRFTGQASM